MSHKDSLQQPAKHCWIVTSKLSGKKVEIKSHDIELQPSAGTHWKTDTGPVHKVLLNA